MKKANFPFEKTLEQFDFRVHPELRRQVFQNYLEESFVKEGRALVLIGAPGLGGVDFNFTSAANQTEQVINLGALIPAKARLVDIFSHTDAVFTGAVSLAADFGTTSGGDELIASGTVYAAQAILAAANAGAFIATPAAAATNVYGNFTPGANWDQVTAGSLSVYITVIDVTHV